MASRVMTVRIDADLLRRLRAAARAERRSLSAQILHLVRRELDVEAPRKSRSRPLPVLGWLAHLDAPDSLEEYRRVRRSLARRLAARVSGHRRR